MGRGGEWRDVMSPRGVPTAGLTRGPIAPELVPGAGAAPSEASSLASTVCHASFWFPVECSLSEPGFHYGGKSMGVSMASG